MIEKDPDLFEEYSALSEPVSMTNSDYGRPAVSPAATVGFAATDSVSIGWSALLCSDQTLYGNTSHQARSLRFTTYQFYLVIINNTI